MTSVNGDTGLRIREVRPQEHAAVGALLSRAYRPFGHFDANPSYEDHVVDVAGRADVDTVLVALLDDEIVGSATVARAGSPSAELAQDGEIELRFVGVEPDRAGRGIAKALVAACEDLGRAEGARRVVISVISWNEVASGLYASLGYVRDDARTWWPVPEVELVVSTKDL
jgi:ribosomal protein S18 acetylase RimI-like enzyme